MRVWGWWRGGVCSLGYDPRPTPSLLRVGMKLSDPDLLQTAEPLLYNTNLGHKVVHGRTAHTGVLLFKNSSFNVPRRAARRRTGMT
jgi:hypothetical protein